MRHLFIPLTIAAFLATASSCSPKTDYNRIEGFAQGGTFHIIYSIPPSGMDEDSVVSMVAGCLRDIDFSISGYNQGSLLSRFNRGEEVIPDRYFKELFIISEKLWNETGGLFDVSGGPLFDFWGFGFKDPSGLDSLRDDAATAHVIDSLLEFVGMDLIELGQDGRLKKKDPRVQLNFNAIAQGYSCDMVARVLDSLGVQNYLVEVGMEITCKGLNPSGKNWRIGIDAPIDGSQTAGQNVQKYLDLTDCGITTSGNYRKFHIIDGKKYAHSINPVTGYPVRHDLLSATVISSDPALGGTYSDAYATYCMVLGKEKAAEFIASRPDLRGYLIYDGGIIEMPKDGSEINTAYGHIEEYPCFRSQYMTPRQILVWLPEGYSESGNDRYDVLYMHDGQMLFDSTSTWNRQEWQVDEVAGRLMEADSIRPVIVVGIAHGSNRFGEYFPEKVLGYLGGSYDSTSRKWTGETLPANGKDADSKRDAFGFMTSSTEYEADGYLRFLTTELKPFIDSRYRTRPEREHTFIAGSSMGGLISLYALCEYPDVFGGAACMSTHLPMITSSLYDKGADYSMTVFQAFLDYLSDNLPEPGSCLLYTDRGDATLDALYPPLQDRLDSLLATRGWTAPEWQTRTFPGQAHVERHWAARLHEPLTFLLPAD